jgi:hypothetical protein
MQVQRVNWYDAYLHGQWWSWFSLPKPLSITTINRDRLTNTFIANTAMRAPVAVKLFHGL